MCWVDFVQEDQNSISLGWEHWWTLAHRWKFSFSLTCLVSFSLLINALPAKDNQYHYVHSYKYSLFPKHMRKQILGQTSMEDNIPLPSLYADQEMNNVTYFSAVWKLLRSSLGIQLWWYMTALNIALFKNHLLERDRNAKARPFWSSLPVWEGLGWKGCTLFLSGLNLHR